MYWLTNSYISDHTFGDKNLDLNTIFAVSLAMQTFWQEQIQTQRDALGYVSKDAVQKCMLEFWMILLGFCKTVWILQ